MGKYFETYDLRTQEIIVNYIENNNDLALKARQNLDPKVRKAIRCFYEANNPSTLRTNG